MSAWQMVVVVSIFVASGVVSAIAGFGFGLMSVPLATLVLDVRRAVVLSTVLGLGVTAFQAWSFGRAAVRPLVVRLSVSAYVGMPLGLWLFVSIDPLWLKVSLGVAILIAVVLLGVGLDLSDAGPGVDVACGFVSGVLNTSLSTNGPPLVFGLQSRHLPVEQFRGTISVTFLICNLASVVIFTAAGKVHLDGVQAALVALPGVLLGLYVGGKLRPRVDERRFRTMVLVLLTISAISAIATA